MLQLKTETIDMFRISKMLAKHNIQGRVSNCIITLYGEISADVLGELCDGTTIYYI